LPLGEFLLNPSSWEESKSSNWVQQNIPGQSDPILQWISGGARVISFQALVTLDTSYSLTDPSQLQKMGAAAATKATNIVGSIASNFAGVNLPPVGDLIGSLGSGSGNELSIAPYLNYYRSLLYPKYEDGKLRASPPLVVLDVGKTFTPNGINDSVSKDMDIFVVADIKIMISKQLPNLSPMEATVDFKLVQYPFLSRSSDYYSLDTEPIESSGANLTDMITKLF